jgi:hypothetical protein
MRASFVVLAALGLMACRDDDLDDDGVSGLEDCDDANPEVGAPVDRYVDADGDDVGSDVVIDFCPGDPGTAQTTGDCDDNDGTVGLPTEFYADADGDGHGVDTRVTACPADSGHADVTGDCDDDEPAAYPGGPETPYDGVDGDCAGDSDFDVDRDGFASASDVEAFESSGGTYTELRPATDCDDLEANIRPNAPEVWYDGVDRNCDGHDDFDKDDDGHASEAAVAAFRENGGVYTGSLPVDDCDDAVPEVHGAHAEVWYDGIDNDCDGRDDFDQDGDLHASRLEVAIYEASGGFYRGNLPEDDCNDDPAAGGASASPGRTEVWYDGIDNDCAGDDDFDQDGDDYASSAAVAAFVTAGGTYRGSLPTTDCVDLPVGQRGIAGSAISPASSDSWYDGVDQNCDGRDDFDQDGDQYASAAGVAAFQGAGGTYTGSLPTTDCADAGPLAGISAAQINPRATEGWYDGVDQNCDTKDDFDRDGDLYASIAGVDVYRRSGGTYAGALPVTDCNDTAGGAAIHPNAVEAWYDGVDQNCAQDDDFDQDRDGYTSESGRAAFVAGGGTYTGLLPDGDCVDDPAQSGAATIKPGATDVWYDGIDRNCDELDDFDQDRDGHASETAVATYEGTGATYAGDLPVDDCADTLAPVGGIASNRIHGSAAEVWYDHVDQDCDGSDDFDQDGDEHADIDGVAAFRGRGGTYDALPVDDCDDTEPLAYEGARELPQDDVDQDCDGRDAVCGEWDGVYGAALSIAASVEDSAISDSCDAFMDITLDEVTGAPLSTTVDCVFSGPLAPLTLQVQIDADAYQASPAGTFTLTRTLDGFTFPEVPWSGTYVPAGEPGSEGLDVVVSALLAEEIVDDGDTATIEPDPIVLDVDVRFTLDHQVLEHASAPGQRIITEIMNNPSLVADDQGEWFEVYNSGCNTVRLGGGSVSDGTNLSNLAPGVRIGPDSFAVFARNIDPAQNGGVTVDHAYTNVILPNGPGTLTITGRGDTPADTVVSTAAFPSLNGRSMSLRPDKFSTSDNDVGANWCASTSVMASGTVGTPGAANDPCP